MPQDFLLPRSFTSARLVLRGWLIKDTAEVYAYSSDPVWGVYLDLPTPYSFQDAKAFIASHSNMMHFPRFSWAITSNGELLGGINIRYLNSMKHTSVGWAIKRPLWGLGYGSEAAEALISMVFRQDQTVSMIKAEADRRNIASIRVMKKVGMSIVEEDLFSNCMVVGTITRHDWGKRTINN